MKELATSGSVFSVEITPASSQYQTKPVRLPTFLASAAAASSAQHRSN
jgi:hypothetical protein